MGTCSVLGTPAAGSLSRGENLRWETPRSSPNLANSTSSTKFSSPRHIPPPSLKENSQSLWSSPQKAIEAGLTSPVITITSTTPLFSFFTSFTRPFTHRAARSAFAVWPTTASSTTTTAAYPVIYITSRSYAKGKNRKMAPKKQVQEEKILLGRPGNNLKSGIVRPAAA